MGTPAHPLPDPGSPGRQARPSASIAADRPGGPVSPLLYGQFAEFMFENIKGGLHAELLRDRGFEQTPNHLGLPRDWERDPDNRNDDAALSFAWDSAIAYQPAGVAVAAPPSESEKPCHSLRVSVGPNGGERRGLRQGGLPIRQGVPYDGYLWARSTDFRGRLRVVLEEDRTDGVPYASTVVSPIDTSGSWRRYPFSLTPSHSDPLAKIAILVEGEGTLNLDQLSLMPGDAVAGVRADVMARVKALRPAFVRWPGGNVAQDYWWTWAIGPRDQRRTWTNLSWRDEPEPSDFGTDEYLAFCREVHAVPTLTVNVEGRGATPQLAADWVEYCNGPASSKYGAIRAANGHPEPYRVRYWEVGNEIWGPWVRGHSDAATYAENFLRYARAMKAVDPSIILIGCGDNSMDWNRTVLGRAGAEMDYLAVHHYYGPVEMKGDARNLQARPHHYERFYQDLRKLSQELLPGKTLPLAINEWNTSLPVPAQHSMEAALYAGRLMNVFVRSEGLVGMSCVSDLVNGWSGGVIQASRHDVFTTGTGLVNELYASRRGARVLPTVVEGPTFDSSLEGSGVPVLDVACTLSEDGRELYVQAVNSDIEQPLRLTLSVTGVEVKDQVRLETVNGPELATPNTFRHPDAIKPSTEVLDKKNLILPAHSVSVITLALEDRP